MSAQVTAMGIRDGDPAVLQALVNRRGASVLAYCERACAPSLTLDAAGDAFTRFRATVLVSTHPGDLDPEAALLAATRHAAAARSPRPPAQSATALGRLLGHRASSERLPELPELLAARADGTLSPEDEQVLDALLDATPVARTIAERFEAAEEAYRTAPRRPLPPAITDQIVETMSTLALAPATGTPVLAIPTAAAPPPRFFKDDTDEYPISVDDAVPDSAEIAATRAADELEPEDPAHLQSASGAVAEEDVDVDVDVPEPLETPEPPEVPEPPAKPRPVAAAITPPSVLPARAGLIPAGAVVAIAAIGAMVASGVFGGNDPSPPVDTGIVPERALQAVPEGEAAAVVDDLRSGAADARRRRLADQRQQLAALAPPIVATPTTTPQTTPTSPDTTTQPPVTTGGTLTQSP